MGGPFSAQSADLWSVWGAKKRVDLMRRRGNLTFSPRGHPLWHTPEGNTLSLAHFRDNVLVGTKGPSAIREMRHVCSVLTETWGLPVLCECMAEEVRICQNKCMTPSLTAMGFTVHLWEHNPPLVYTQPSGLTSSWHLKYTATLHCSHHTPRHTSIYLTPS